jgi:non-ribosomal peptide synthase protein (TIGR01720 family)
MKLSLHAFAEFLRRYGIENMFLTAALFNQLANEVPGAFQTLHTVLVGGDAVDPKAARNILKDRPPLRLLNGYGPTESTTFATWHPIKAVPEEATTIPIGRPLANTETYILDRYLHLVPVGTPGELYIGGDGLARGYLRRPDQTAERFIPHPFRAEPGARLYKTGDLVRYNEEGSIEFLGRLDHQIKIRGFRVEPGEIEATLKQHPAVNEAVVLVLQATPGEKRLAAYLISRGPLTVSEIRDYLSTRLPAYMIPASFVLLDSLPLTANGKLDRQALLALDAREAIREQVPTAPRTSLEEILTRIWSQVLGVEHVDVFDNFFELGGDSILCFQIVARASEAGIPLLYRQIFEHKTIAQLAASLSPHAQATPSEESITGMVPLTPLQHWFFEQQVPQIHHWNQSYLLTVQQPLRVDWLEQALTAVLAQHEMLHVRFQSTLAGWQQVVGESPEVQCTLVDLSALPAQMQAVALENATASQQRSLDITTGPLFRAALFSLAPGKITHLMLVAHHLVVDGVSWRILLEDVQRAYAQVQRSEPLRLFGKTTSLKKWMEHLQQATIQGLFQTDLAFWRTVGQSGLCPVPLDLPDGLNTEASARTYHISLEAQETSILLQQVSQFHKAQITDILLTALLRAWQEWTGSSSLLLDLERHGREPFFDELDLSRTVGWFTSVFPLSLNAAVDQDLSEQLQKVKEQLQAVPQHGAGYGILRYLHQDPAVREELRSFPRPELSFNYLGQFDQSLAGETSEVSAEVAPLFRLAQELYGPDHNAQGLRWHVLDINGIVVEACLHIHWTYSANLHHSETIERFAHCFLQTLRTLIQQSLSVPTSTELLADSSRNLSSGEMVS